MKLGLANTQALLEYLGNPQTAYKTFHIAGTNGKGSTSAMIAAALQSNGFKTGLYTSPHLVNFTERVKVNGVEMPREYITDFMNSVADKIEELQATFFEVTTCLAFNYFRDAKIDIAVIETGLGGRLDSTNVIEAPLATVITSIGLEHTQHLGDTLEKIAFEKAGIIKSGSPAIVNVRDEIKDIFRKKAAEVHSLIYFTDETSLEGFENIRCPFLGTHQEQNMKSALIALEKSKLTLDPIKIKNGIENTIQLTGLRGRLEEYPSKEGKLILDVAHNPDAFRALRDHFLSRDQKPFIVAGFAKDKDIHAIFKIFQEFASGFIAVAANNHRAIDANELAAVAQKYFPESITAASIPEAVAQAFSLNNLILLTGSHYVVGEFLAAY